MARKAEKILSWGRDDFERRLGFKGGRYTKVGAASSCFLVVLATAAFYVVLLLLPDSAFKRMFTERGWTPYAVVLLGFWSLMILMIKSSKIRLQRAALSRSILPDDPRFHADRRDGRRRRR